MFCERCGRDKLNWCMLITCVSHSLNEGSMFWRSKSMLALDFLSLLWWYCFYRRQCKVAMELTGLQQRTVERINSSCGLPCGPSRQSVFPNAAIFPNCLICRWVNFSFHNVHCFLIYDYMHKIPRSSGPPVTYHAFAVLFAGRIHSISWNTSTLHLQVISLLVQ